MSVNSYLNSLASDLVLKDSEKISINISISTLSTRINNYFSDVEEHFRFGSHTRGTILPRKADEKSDIDYMIVFNNTIKYKPQTFLNKLKNFASYYYSTSEIKQSYPTIVLELNHIKFELVPAYKNTLFFESEYKIPAPSNYLEEWITTDPNGFNKKLTEINSNNNSMIKPVIRLIKYWNALNGYIYSSYFLEQHIINSWYFLCTNTQDYFKKVVDDLPEYGIGLSETKRNKVSNLKRDLSVIYDNIEKYPYTAELGLKEILPEL